MKPPEPDRENTISPALEFFARYAVLRTLVTRLAKNLFSQSLQRCLRHTLFQLPKSSTALCHTGWATFDTVISFPVISVERAAPHNHARIPPRGSIERTKPHANHHNLGNTRVRLSAVSRQDLAFGMQFLVKQEHQDNKIKSETHYRGWEERRSILAHGHTLQPDACQARMSAVCWHTIP